MKGTSFQKPLELNLFVEGESWSQSDDIQGRLTIKNHGAQSLPVADVQVHLAHGNLTKVRQKASGALKVLGSAQGAPAELQPQAEASFDWRFTLDRNSPITDSLSSLFLVYGPGADLEKIALLQLNVRPYRVIEDFLTELGTTYRFVVKGQKWSKDWIEVKLSPSSSKAFAAVESLVLSFHFDGDALEVEYLFNVRKVDAGPGTADVKKDQREFSQRYSLEQYRTPSGRFNDERIKAGMKDVFDQIEAKVLY